VTHATPRKGAVCLDLTDLLREAVVAGRLREPFTPREAAAVVAPAGWDLARVRSHLVRHCQGNLAAPLVIYERVAYGAYRLLADGPRGPAAGRAARRAPPRLRKSRGLEPAGRP
jgi:hypothetical protein